MHAFDPSLFPSPEKLTQRLPGYQVDRLIDSRGATALYRGLQLSLKRPVDIKVMPHNAQVPELVKRRFLREAHAMAQLSHPHVVNVYDHGEVPGLCQYIVFEEGAGTTLREMLARPLDPAEALRIVSDVAEAVAYTHERDIVHRNINPDHVLVNERGRAKLRDFSLAKMDGDETVMAHRSGVDDTVNRFNQAPEYHRGDAMDHRSDVFSLGALFYEMLTAKVPQKSFSPPSQLVPVSARVDKVVLRCMHADRAKRFHTVQELINALEPLRDHPEWLTAARRPIYARLIPKTLYLLLTAFLISLLILLFK